MTAIERPRVLLSVQRALLGAITPQVRVVDLCWNDSEIRVRFVVDGEIEPKLREITTLVETEILADFIPDADASVCVERIDKGSPVVAFASLSGEAARAYARHED